MLFGGVGGEVGPAVAVGLSVVVDIIGVVVVATGSHLQLPANVRKNYLLARPKEYIKVISSSETGEQKTYSR